MSKESEIESKDTSVSVKMIVTYRKNKLMLVTKVQRKEKLCTKNNLKRLS